MTPGGYWPPSLRAEIGNFGSGMSCSFSPLHGFLFSCLCGTFSFVLAYVRENSSVQPLAFAAKHSLLTDCLETVDGLKLYLQQLGNGDIQER
jgi:hypothetical protein